MMKKITALILSVIMCLMFAGCKSKERALLPEGFGGKYLTDAAYGMDDFTSEIEFELDDMEFDYEVEHFGEEVEEDDGKFKFKDNVVTLIGKNGTKTLKYDPSAKTLYSEEMDTTWTHSSVYIKSKKAENTNVDNTAFGKYTYSDESIDAEIVINENGFSLKGKAKTDGDSFDAYGTVQSLEDSLVFTEEEESPVICKYDSSAGTINYDGMVFTLVK